MLDARVEENPVSIATFPLPPVEEFGGRGGRYGSHNLHENRPGPAFRSETIIFGSYFNGGIRAFDITNPYRPRRSPITCRPRPKARRAAPFSSTMSMSTKTRIVYAIDRGIGGLYIMEVDL